MISTCSVCHQPGHIKSSRCCPQFHLRPINPRTPANIVPNANLAANTRNAPVDDDDGEDDDENNDTDNVLDEIDVPEDIDDDIEENNELYHWISTEMGPAETRVFRGKTIEISNIPVFVEEKKVGITKAYVEKLDGVAEADFLALYITIMDKFVGSTNWYGRTKIVGWSHDVDKKEMKLFFAIVLTLGMIKYPNRYMAFNDPLFSCKMLSEFMGEERFGHLLRAWHYENYEGKTDADIANIKENNPFWAVNSLATTLAQSYREAY